MESVKLNSRANHVDQSQLFDLQSIRVSEDWAFSDAKRSDTAYITHGYHRYPAKFIPQLARRVIDEHTNVGDTVLDPFSGCGTTLVESVVSGRSSYGFDINPIAVMISRAKIQYLDPQKIMKSYVHIENSFSKSLESLPTSERISYWFRDKEIEELSRLLNSIQCLQEEELRLFNLCCFSNILKNCSIWNQKSNKPSRDFEKKIPDVRMTFARHFRSMMKGNEAFWTMMKDKKFSNVYSAIVECKDSRCLPLSNKSVDLVVTSPPYVTSYEYADLHQLSMLWLEDLQDLKQFRSKFIGSASLNSSSGVVDCSKDRLNSETSRYICNQLNERGSKKYFEVKRYFEDMYKIWEEVYRVMKPRGRVAIVVGNTRFQDVEINNAKVFVEQLQALNFDVIELIQRRIPSKILPSIRDKNTGRFAKALAPNNVLVYPTEFILLMEKRN